MLSRNCERVPIKTETIAYGELRKLNVRGFVVTKAKRERYKVIRQDWLESERDWGQKPDGFSLHLSPEHHKKFIDNYDKNQPKEQDVYSRPDGEPKEVYVCAKTYKEVKASKNGVRTY